MAQATQTRCTCGQYVSRRADAFDTDYDDYAANEASYYDADVTSHDCRADYYGASAAPRDGEEAAYLAALEAELAIDAELTEAAAEFAATSTPTGRTADVRNQPTPTVPPRPARRHPLRPHRPTSARTGSGRAVDPLQRCQSSRYHPVQRTVRPDRHPHQEGMTMRHIITPAELGAQMAEATDEQLRLLQLYGKPYAVRAAQYEVGVRRGVAARERFNAAERNR